MSKLTNALVTAVTLATLTTQVMAANCSREEKAVERKQDNLNSIAREIRSVEREQSRVDDKISDLLKEIERAEKSLRNAEKALSDLRYTNAHAPEIIRSHRQSLKQIQAALPAEERKEQELKDKYKKMKKNILTVFKRIKARDKWKDQEKKVQNMKNQALSHKNKVQEVKNIVENFDVLEDQKISSIDFAERRLEEARDNHFEISRLNRESSELRAEIHELESKKRKVQDRLFVAQEALNRCKAEPKAE